MRAYERAAMGHTAGAARVAMCMVGSHAHSEHILTAHSGGVGGVGGVGGDGGDGYSRDRR